MQICISNKIAEKKTLIIIHILNRTIFYNVKKKKDKNEVFTTEEIDKILQMTIYIYIREIKNSTEKIPLIVKYGLN